MADLWESANTTAVAVVESTNRYRLVETVLAGHEAGLSREQIAERLKPLMDDARKDFDADVIHMRLQLLATASEIQAP